jgi:hypothetical protein
MIADSHAIDPSVSSQPRPAWPDVWHLWTVIIPRRSSPLVWGTVWRRSDGRHWIYKKVIEYSDNGAE